MLLSFRVENHKSLREEQQLLLTPVYEDSRPRDAGWEAVTVAGIFGANASGKSNLLDALALMRETVRWSMRDNEPGGGIPRQPFAFEAPAAEEPSTFVVDLALDGVRHTYGFAMDDERVTEEWLYTYPKKRKRVVFEREGDDFSFGEHTPAKLRQVEAITAENTLFLTVAARTANDEVEPVYRWFSQGLALASESRRDRPSWLGRGEAGERELDSLSRLLRAAGTGVVGVELVEDEAGRGPAAGVRPRSMADRRRETRDSAGTPAAQALVHSTFGSGKSRVLSQLLSEVMEAGGSDTLVFHHVEAGDYRPLRWEEESSGTRTLATLGFEAQRAVEGGGVLVVDEIDASLHPYLSATLISLFRDEKHNPKGAQLVFTSHDAALLGNVLGEEVLRRDHVWFVEKDDRARTSLYPLSDFKPRSDENRTRRYLVGRYGAVPDLDDELFRDALRLRTETPGAGAGAEPKEGSLR